jgi:hypothetical protein
VVPSVEQQLEGPMIEKFIQDFAEQGALAMQQVDAGRAKLEAFKVELPKTE